MLKIELPAQMQAFANQCHQQTQRIAFVPTMGALHQGHISLIEKAASLADVVVVSIFVNPTQFNNPDDLKNYPRSLETDLLLLENLPVAAVFLPSEAVMYPAKPMVTMHIGHLGQVLEAQHRPGHFGGVALVVAKLFNIVKPNIAVFGQKDLQQVAVVKQMVADLNFDIEIVTHPTHRSKTGLALSSRNQRLSEQGLQKAAFLYQSLLATNNSLQKHQNPAEARQNGLNVLYEQNIEVEYLEIICPYTFKKLEKLSNNSEFAICLAAYVEGVRLIDNITSLLTAQ